ERRQMPPQVVATPLLELLEEPRRPIRLSGRIVDLVRVVEERAKPLDAMPRERAIEAREVMMNRVAREMIDDVPFAAGRGALDELAVPAEKHAVERPRPGRRRPVERRGRADA